MMDLVARLSLKDDLSARMRKASGEIGKASKQTMSLTERVGGLKSAIAGLGVTVGLGAMVKGIISVGVNFDTQMSKVKAISGATAEEFDKLQFTARDLAKTTKYTMTEAGSAMEYLALAGWKTEAIISAMPGMLDLAAAGALDLGRAADITSDTMQAFGINASNATHVADIFAYAQSNANTSVEQLGEAMKYLAPVSNALGWKLEESSAAMMAVADAGIKGSMGGQAFATSLARLARPTTRMEKEMKRLGISLFDTKGNLKTLPDVIGELEKATKGMTNQQKSSTISTMFGAQAYKHWAVLLERGSESLGKLTTELENADGAAARMAADMINNLGGDWDILKAGLAEAAYTVYKLFEPSMRSGMHAMTDFVSKVPAATNSVVKFVKPFIPLAKAIGIAVAAVGSFFALVGTFKLIGSALLFLTSPIGLAIGAITALVLGFKHFYKESAPFRAVIDKIVGGVKALHAELTGKKAKAMDLMTQAGLNSDQIKGIFDFARKIKSVMASIGQGDGKGLMAALGFSPETINMVAGFVSKVVGTVKALTAIMGGSQTDGSIMLTRLGFSQETIAKIFGFINTVKAKAGEFVAYLKSKWDAIQPGIAALMDTFTMFKDNLVNIFTSLWGFLQPIFGALMVAFQIVADVVVIAFNNVIAPVIRIVMAVIQLMWKIVGPILKLLGAAIGLAFGVLKIVWDTVLKPVVNFLTTVFKKALELALPILKKVGEGFDVVGGVISQIAGWLKDFTGALKSFKVPNWLSKLGGGGTVKFEETSADGQKHSHYNGIDYVPYNGYQITAHKGERLQTAQEVREGKQGGNTYNFSVNMSGSGNTKNDAKALMEEMARLIERESGQMGW